LQEKYRILADGYLDVQCGAEVRILFPRFQGRERDGQVGNLGVVGSECWKIWMERVMWFLIWKFGGGFVAVYGHYYGLSLEMDIQELFAWRKEVHHLKVTEGQVEVQWWTSDAVLMSFLHEYDIRHTISV